MEDEIVPFLGERKESTRKDMHPVTMALMFSFCAATNLVQNATLVVVLPLEVDHLFPSKPAQTLSFLYASAFVLSIFQPLLGLWSDRTTAKWGRRR
jgi:hypothetical protein